jgi:hypothetical protein
MSTLGNPLDRPLRSDAFPEVKTAIDTGTTRHRQTVECILEYARYRQKDRLAAFLGSQKYPPAVTILADPLEMASHSGLPDQRLFCAPAPTRACPTTAAAFVRLQHTPERQR